MVFASLLKLCVLLVMFCASLQVSAEHVKEHITVYTAKKIITMDTTQPTATAVAVQGKRIVSVGSLDDLKPWLDTYPHTIDDRFKDKVLLPGLIDPHLHPFLGAIQFGTEWITPESWQLHDGNIPATQGHEDYLSQLELALKRTQDDGKPMFITWGWSALEHGNITRELLDKLDSSRPVMVLHRSAHEAVFNTAALNYMKLTEQGVKKYRGVINWSKGHFIESGFFNVALPRLTPYLLSPAFIDAGYQRLVEYLKSGGITTIADMATGELNWQLELDLLKRHFAQNNEPIRTVIVPSVKGLTRSQGDLDSAFEVIDNFQSSDMASAQIVNGKRVKLFADGAMFSQLMRIGTPGYIDGHHGEWITANDTYIQQARKFWQAGYRIHVHANGDTGIDYALNVLQKLQREIPGYQHKLIIEHYGYANDYVNRRVAELGAMVSANPFYVFALGDSYAKRGLGADRARRITPISGLVDRGVIVTLHSDFGMAPARPLYLAWSAINRQTQQGKVYNPPRGLTLDEALKGITIDAAIILGLDKDTGSIEAGKLADITILEQDPYSVPITELKHIPIWGTMFEGQVSETVIQ